MQNPFIQIYRRGERVDYHVNRFPDGQIQFCLPNDFRTAGYVVYASVPTSTELDLLLQILNTVPVSKLKIMYSYGARCDKKTNQDFDTLCDVNDYVINLLHKHTANIDFVDKHSGRVRGISNSIIEYMNQWTWERPGTYVCYPDAGSWSRYGSITKNQDLFFRKERDQVTGEIISHTLDEASKSTIEQMGNSSQIYVVDDICDGGATFANVAKQIRAVNDKVELNLAVTHGVFSGNFAANLAEYNNVYVTDSLPNYIDAYKRLRTITTIHIWPENPWDDGKLTEWRKHG